MALIPCPECGKEISDQAPACIHCGYPLPPKEPEPNRFSVVLTAKCNYPENRRRTIRVLIDELGISKTEAEAYMDNTELGPVLLRSGMTEESARDFAGILARAGAHVQVVDGSQPCDLAPHTGSATPRPHLWRGGLGRNPGQPVSGACRIRNFRLLIPALSRRRPLWSRFRPPIPSAPHLPGPEPAAPGRAYFRVTQAIIYKALFLFSNSLYVGVFPLQQLSVNAAARDRQCPPPRGCRTPPTGGRCPAGSRWSH